MAETVENQGKIFFQFFFRDSYATHEGKVWRDPHVWHNLRLLAKKELYINTLCARARARMVLPIYQVGF